MAYSSDKASVITKLRSDNKKLENEKHAFEVTVRTLQNEIERLELNTIGLVTENADQKKRFSEKVSPSARHNDRGKSKTTVQRLERENARFSEELQERIWKEEMLQCENIDLTRRLETERNNYKQQILELEAQLTDANAHQASERALASSIQKQRKWSDEAEIPRNKLQTLQAENGALKHQLHDYWERNVKETCGLEERIKHLENENRSLSTDVWNNKHQVHRNMNETSTLQDKIDEMEIENTNLTKENQKLKQEIECNTRKAKERSSHFQSSSDDIKSKEMEIKRLQQENKRLQNSIEMHTKDNAELRDKLKQIKDENDTKQKTILEMQHEKDSILKQLHQMDRGIAQQGTSELQMEIERLQGGNRRLEEHRDTLENSYRRETDELKDKLYQLQMTNDEMNKTTRDLKRNDDSYGKEAVELQDKLKQLQKRNDEMAKTIPDLKQSNDSYSKETVELQAKLDQLQTENDGMKKTIPKLQQSRESYKRESDEGKDMVNQLQITNDEMNKTIRGLKRNDDSYGKEAVDLQDKLKQLQTRNDEMAKTIRDLKQSNDSYSKETVELQAKLDQLQTENDAMNKTIRKLQQSRESIRQEVKQVEKTSTLQSSVQLEMEMQRLQQENQGLKEDVEALRNRLSRMAGANLLHSNPNIADLSDENRATKLGEKYAELYDNEWTDASEEIMDDQGKSEEEGIKLLLNILTTVHDSCQKLSVQYLKALTTAATTIPEVPQSTDIKQLPVEINKQIKDLRKGLAVQLVQHVQSTSENLILKKLGPLGEKTLRYVHKCTELSWLMSVQDPPVVVDHWDQRPGALYNGDLFRFYTRTGNVMAYVVWPPLFLKDNGPLLCKGVAQATKS